MTWRALSIRPYRTHAGQEVAAHGHALWDGPVRQRAGLRTALAAADLAPAAPAGAAARAPASQPSGRD